MMRLTKDTVIYSIWSGTLASFLVQIDWNCRKTGYKYSIMCEKEDICKILLRPKNSLSLYINSFLPTVIIEITVGTAILSIKTTCRPSSRIVPFIIVFSFVVFLIIILLIDMKSLGVRSSSFLLTGACALIGVIIVIISNATNRVYNSLIPGEEKREKIGS